MALVSRVNCVIHDVEVICGLSLTAVLTRVPMEVDLMASCETLTLSGALRESALVGAIL